MRIPYQLPGPGTGSIATIRTGIFCTSGEPYACRNQAAMTHSTAPRLCPMKLNAFAPLRAARFAPCSARAAASHPDSTDTFER